MKSRLLLLLLVLNSTDISFSQENGAKFVWQHDQANVRNEYVYFRNQFNLDNIPDIAEISLYVDSRYQLYVNEIFINFGPARAYPIHPEYDTHNIRKYLHKGKNVIAVKALHNGIENFQVPMNRPGFIAWGNIENNSEISLETPGNWMCKKSEGYDQNAVRFSFACAAMEVFDSRKENYDWKGTKTDISDWARPAEINDQDAWGKLIPRTIPHLIKTEINAKNVVSIFKMNVGEDIYQFRIKTPDELRTDYNRKDFQCMAYTYIYSPIDQDIEVGLWWGEFFLNGEGPLNGLGEEPARTNRDPRILSLKEGWNFFNFYYGAIWGAWDFYMAVPKSSNLKLSPSRKMDDQVAFMSTGPYSEKVGEKISSTKQGFKTAMELLKFYEVEWEERKRDERTNNPALDMVWNLSETKVDFEDWKVNNIEIPAKEGSAITFDIGRKTLGKYYVEFEAPEGTIIDLGLSEDLYNDKAWLFKRKMISAATRVICDGEIKRFETFKPYGLRYIQINVTNHSLPVKIKRVGVIEQVYPFNKIGFFECSDPMFNSIWELGWRTLRVCAEDSYTDTPFRERGLYAGDMLPEYAITLATNGDSRLLKRSLKYFHDQYHDEMFKGVANRHEDFLLINIISSKWYYDYTNDKQLVEFVYEGYKSLMQKWVDSQNAEGIMFTGRQFIEWTRIDKDAKLTATHALLAEALNIMANYAEILIKHADAEFFKKKSLEVSKLVENYFWDDEKQLFNDGYKNDVLIGKYYPTSNAWPLLYNCTNDEQTGKVIDYLEAELKDIGEKSRDRRITPYSSFYAIAALYQHERADIAERFMRKYWTRMILNGDDTAWENFDIGSEIQGGGQGTASHAWSGHPTYFLTTEALGVSLGFHKEFEKDTILISPQSSTLNWAKGRVPHPAGVIDVDWKIEGGRLFLNYICENDVDVLVNPRGRLAEYELWINGVKKEDSFN